MFADGPAGLLCCQACHLIENCDADIALLYHITVPVMFLFLVTSGWVGGGSVPERQI